MLTKYFKSSVILVLVLGCGRPSDSYTAATKAKASDDWIGTVDPVNNSNLPSGSLALTDNQESVLISRPEYELSWNSNTRDINWASWLLSSGDIGKTGRSGFSKDGDLDSYLTASGKQAVSALEYTGTCFDRGHQVPSKDRTGNHDENVSVFRMSNMIPQTAYLNRTLWERLEAQTRSVLTREPGTKLWIVAGPIFGKNLRYIGPNSDIAVPTANFKVVIDLGTGKKSVPKLFAAVIMPNLTSKGTDPLDDPDTNCSDSANMSFSDGVKGATWQDYSATISDIEKEAGIDLAPLRDLLDGSSSL